MTVLTSSWVSNAKCTSDHIQIECFLSFIVCLAICDLVFFKMSCTLVLYVQQHFCICSNESWFGALKYYSACLKRFCFGFFIEIVFTWQEAYHMENLKTRVTTWNKLRASLLVSLFCWFVAWPVRVNITGQVLNCLNWELFAGQCASYINGFYSSLQGHVVHVSNLRHCEPDLMHSCQPFRFWRNSSAFYTIFHNPIGMTKFRQN